MAQPESAQVDASAEAAVPIVDSEAETSYSQGGAPKRPFVLEKKRGAGGGNMPLMLMVLGAVVIFGIGMLAFLSTKGTTKQKTAAEAAKPNLGRVAASTAPGDLIPSDKVKPSPDETKKGGAIDAADIEKTKAPKMAQPQAVNVQSTSKGGKQLGQVARFEEPDTSPNSQTKWTPPPYSEGQKNDGQNGQQLLKKEEDSLNQPSLVFIAHVQNSGGTRTGSRDDERGISNLGLAPGYHVAARLESMATTAVHSAVTAVVEYNYERDGEILIPAGTRVIGKITQADPSGFVNITFSSIEFPEKEPETIDAVAANMNLQAIKGKVTGKQAGKSMLMRSVAGLGETAAMIIGAPSANSAFSENDLLRMRVADNIGNASDQQIMQMMTMQHIVVSVDAGTEIYVIFQKSQQADPGTGEKTVHIPHMDNATLESNTPTQP